MLLGYQYLYQESGDFIFMNQETYEQIPIHKDLITGVDFMKEGDVVDVVSDASTETVLYAEMPIKTQLKITYNKHIETRYCRNRCNSPSSFVHQRGRDHRS